MFFSAVKSHRSVAVGIAAALVLGAVPLFGVQSAEATPAAPASTGIKAQVPVDANGKPLGAISGFQQDGARITLKPASGALRVTFLDAKNFRIEADPSGTLSDPANTSQNDPARSANLVVGADQFSAVPVTVTDGARITLATSAVKLEVDKASGKFTLRRADGSLVWTEAAPLSFGNSSTTQALAGQPGEQFLGGGMQNGRSVHTGQVINISKDYNWADGGNPNAVPYYMSSAGYGVFRNTFAPGSYDFGSTQAAASPLETSTHQEKRFDAYYFVGDYKQALDGYTKLTGRPMMPPVYALEYGDADCYNRSNPDYSSSGFNDPKAPKQNTFDAVKTAEQFKANDMPGAWMLVNDGYGCEYTKDPDPYDPANPGKGLGGTVQEIQKVADLKTGLWTQRSLTNQPLEVGQDGIALRKLDVAWVGEGYRMALTGCESAHNGIEQYSANRGVALMVEGWAGSQRCGIQWTGDHTGSLDAIRWQVPAIAGSGNSGLAFTTADVDGIFGGSPESYVRDLQWKAFAPALYSMSGWAPTDKRPWLYGDAATAINRSYLQLRQQLMPYIYSLAAGSHANGTPMARTMALEFPQDPASYSAEANNQFMLGPDYLVAPVSASTDIRNGIVLPAGSQWVDYWTGNVYQGGQTLNGYKAPLQTLPLFVRAGALVPQGIVARNASLVPEDSALTLNVYPSGSSAFSLYEDDKTSRAYRQGKNTVQDFAVQAPAKNAGDVTVTIGARKGDYSGMAASRPYELKVNSGSKPSSVVRDGAELSALVDQKAFDAAQTGWYYDTAAGTVRVKAGQVAKDASTVVVLKDSSAVGGKDSDATAAQVKLSLDKQVFQGAKTTATASFSNNGDRAKTDLKLSIKTPTGWTVDSVSGDSVANVPAGGTVTAKFVVVPGQAAAAGVQTLEAVASYQDSAGTAQSVSGANQLDVAYSSLAGAFNAVSVTTVAGKASGNFDGGGATFAAEQLASAPIPAGGVKPGGTVPVTTADGTVINYPWPAAGPDVNNSVALNGQTIALKGTGTHLAVLASAASGKGVSPELTLTYADGTKQKQTVFFPNWLQPKDLGGGVLAVSSQGRNNANGPSPEYTQYKYQAFSNSLRLIPGKELASVTLPVATNVKFFDWKVVTQKLPAAPDQDVFASDWPWVSASNGYGVIGKDVANKDAVDSPDLPLAINYTDPATGTNPSYAKGLGAHAPSKITYYLGGQCSSFSAAVGLEKDFGGKIIFTVNGDGRQLYQSRTFTPGFAPEPIKTDLTGVQYLELSLDPANADAINGAHGIWGNAKFNCAAPDTEAPVTTASVNGTPSGSGWYLNAPTVSLSATDNVAVASTQYRSGGSAWTDYTAPVSVPDGVQNFEYRSTDKAGNVEAAKSLALKVDTVLPEVSATVADRKVALAASDAGSGIAATEYSLDGGQTWQGYSAPVAAGDGGLSLLYRASDQAGNVSAAAPAVIVAPISVQPAAPKIEAPQNAVAGGSIKVSLNGFDAGASVEIWLHSTPVRLGSLTVGADGTGSAQLTIPADVPAGAHTLTAVLIGTTVASSAILVVAGAGQSGNGQSDGGGSGNSVNPAAVESNGPLAETGTEIWPLLLLGFGSLAAGAVVLALRRRPRS